MVASFSRTFSSFSGPVSRFGPGFLNSATIQSQAHLAAAFRGGLEDAGYTEGRNVAIEYRWADGYYGRLPDLAADLVHRRVAVIAATGGTVAAVAAKQATTEIPIVFVMGADPIKAGLVESLNSPGTNVTGVTMFSVSLTAKRIELIHEVAPNARTVVMLVNPNSADAQAQSENAEEAAHAIGEQIQIIKAGTEDAINSALEALARQPATCLIVANDAFFSSRAQQIATLATHFRLPAVYPFREFAAAGGLLSYATKLAKAYGDAGSYVARILKGAKAADLPVLQPTKFELVINLKTAKALGLVVPPSLLATADEVIE